MGIRGKKTCPNCKKAIGVNTKLCKCGYHYPSNKIRPDLLAEKEKKAETKTYKEVGRGRKKCPKCSVIIGGNTQICICGFDFIVHKKEVDELREKEKAEKAKKKAAAPQEKMSPLTAEIMAGLAPYEAPPIPTKKDHAKRILGLGEKRARILLLQHRIHHCWSHVDWDFVEKKLAG
jgi:hypothetical protein